MRIIPAAARLPVDCRNRCVDRTGAARASAGATAHRPKEPPMPTHPTNDPRPVDELDDEPIPAMQQLLDNPFLLLFIGVAMPTVLYVIWGVMEIVGIPVAK
jgi:hypothetical protein